MRRRAFLGLTGCGALALTVAACTADKASSARTTAAGSDGAAAESGSAMASPEAAWSRADGLPFGVRGLGASAPVDLPDAVTASTSSPLWSFGGDYSLIGSFPLDTTTVFGSTTSTPDDVASSVPALITATGARTWDGWDEAMGDVYLEPQDATGDDDLIVMRATPIDEGTLGASRVDDWVLFALRTDLSDVTRLCAASDLNPGGDTPVLDADIVPMLVGDRVVFASLTQGEDGDSWTPVVLTCPVGGGDPVVVGSGLFPAVTGKQILYGALASDGASVTRVVAEGEEDESLAEVEPGDGSWSVTGLWAAQSHRALAVSGDGDSGTYLATWDEDRPEAAQWWHVPSATLVASANADRLVFGAGSQSEHAQMYAYSWGEDTPELLGECPGGARPQTAPSGGAVLVPRLDDGAAAFAYDVVDLVS